MDGTFLPSFNEWIEKQRGLKTLKKTVGIVAGIISLGLVMAGCTKNENTLPSQDEKKQSAETSSSVASSSQDNTQSTVSSSQSSAETTAGNGKIKISVEDVINSYETAYPNTAITSLDLDQSLGSYYYELSGVDDTTQYEVKINAETGELTKEREEKLDRDEANGIEKENEALDLNNLLSIAEAEKIALDTAGQGEAVEWSLDRELSTTYWEVKVKNGRSETSVKMNAQTGEVLETELDD